MAPLTPHSDTSDLLNQLRETDAEPAPVAELVPPRIVIDVEYSEADGALLTGRIVAVVPTIAMMREIGLLEVKLRVGISAEDLGPETVSLLNARAYLAVVCDAKNGGESPPWFARGEYRDPQLLGRVYQEVTEHAARFRGACRDRRAGRGAATRPD